MSQTYPDPSPLAEPSTSDPGGAPTAVLEREQVAHRQVEPGDHERFAHYVRKEKVLESALSGDPVVALCGKVWVPGRDPKRFPVCPACKSIYESIASRGDSGGGDSRGGSSGDRA